MKAAHTPKNKQGLWMCGGFPSNKSMTHKRRNRKIEDRGDDREIESNSVLVETPIPASVGSTNSDQDGLARCPLVVALLPRQPSSMEAEDIQELQDVTVTVQEVSNKQAKGTKGNDGGAEETDYRADLEVTFNIEGYLERYFVDFTNSSIHTNKTRDSKKLRHTVGVTANEAERLEVKHYERHHHECRIVPFAQDLAGG